jgi:hypothetical protein
MSRNRAKLDTAVEKEMYKLVREIKEHTFDFTMLYVRKNNVPVDSNQMKLILEIVDKAIMDGFQRNLDRTMKGLDGALTEFASEENPLPSSAE